MINNRLRKIYGQATCLIPNPSDWVKLAIVVVCTYLSLWLGYAFARQIYIEGWQFWVWLSSVLITLTLLYRTGLCIERREIVTLSSLVILALILRVINQESIPGAFHVDEAGVAKFARDSLFPSPGLVLNPFITGPASQPALYHYIIHFSMKLVGFSISGARLSSAVAGSLGVAATYLMVKRISGRQTALLSAIVMAFSHFSIHFSRLALNNIWDTLWVPLTLYLFLKSREEDWPGGAVLAGAALGLSQYFYHGSKIVLFLLPVLFFARWENGSGLKRKLLHLSYLGITALVVAGPLLMFSFSNPEIFYARLQDDWGWKQKAISTIQNQTGITQYVWYQVIHSLGVYTIFPDPNGFYHPSVPLVFGMSSLLFLGGVLIAGFQRTWLPLIWIALASFFGGFLLSVPDSSPHYVVTIPAICWLIGLTIQWIWKSGQMKLAMVLMLTAIVIDFFFYFGVYTYSIPPDFNIPFPPPG